MDTSLDKLYKIKLDTHISEMKLDQIILMPSPYIADAAIKAIPDGYSINIPTRGKTLAEKMDMETTHPID